MIDRNILSTDYNVYIQTIEDLMGDPFVLLIIFYGHYLLIIDSSALQIFFFLLQFLVLWMLQVI